MGKEVTVKHKGKCGTLQLNSCQCSGEIAVLEIKRTSAGGRISYSSLVEHQTKSRNVLSSGLGGALRFHPSPDP